MFQDLFLDKAFKFIGMLLLLLFGREMGLGFLNVLQSGFLRDVGLFQCLKIRAEIFNFLK